MYNLKDILGRSVYFLCDFYVFLLSLSFNIFTVWAQDDLLRLLEAMKVALPQKDLTKYKTSESHLDWQKVAFNSYTAEMCKQKWQVVSKEVSWFVSIFLQVRLFC